MYFHPTPRSRACQPVYFFRIVTSLPMIGGPASVLATSSGNFPDAVDLFPHRDVLASFRRHPGTIRFVRAGRVTEITRRADFSAYGRPVERRAGRRHFSDEQILDLGGAGHDGLAAHIHGGARRKEGDELVHVFRRLRPFTIALQQRGALLFDVDVSTARSDAGDQSDQAGEQHASGHGAHCHTSQTLSISFAELRSLAGGPMPDSDWRLLGPTESRRYEDEYGQQHDPEPGYFMRHSLSGRLPFEDAVTEFSEKIWADLEITPRPTGVSEFCSRCPEHTHTVGGHVPVALEDHVLELSYGDHRGVRYRNAHIVGVEIRRQEIHTIPDNPGTGPDDTVLDTVIDANGHVRLILRHVRETRTVTWSVRDIDHWKDGIEWQPFDTRWCTSSGGYYVGFNQAADLLVASIGAATRRGETAPVMMVNEFLPLITAAMNLRRPQFQITATRDGWTLALHDGEIAGKPAHSEHAVVTAGRLRIVDRT